VDIEAFIYVQKYFMGGEIMFWYLGVGQDLCRVCQSFLVCKKNNNQVSDDI